MTKEERAELRRLYSSDQRTARSDIKRDLLSLLDALEAALVDANSYRVIRTLVEHDYQLRVRFYQVLGMAESELAKRKAAP